MPTDTAPTPERDRRVIRRKPVKKGVTVVARRGTMGLGPNLAIMAKTLSDDGMSLQVTQQMAKGDEIELLVTGIGRSKPERLIAEVRWCHAVFDEAGEEAIAYAIGARFRKRIPYAELSNYV